MSLKENEWTEYSIEEVGISFQLYRAWPALPLEESGYAGVYQPVADTSGIVFVRYGTGQTVGDYVRKLGGMLTKVSILSDRRFIYRGKRARGVTVALDTSKRRVYFQNANEGASHKTFPAERVLISVIGFRHRGIPVLTGYRIPKVYLKTYKSILGHMVNGVSF